MIASDNYHEIRYEGFGNSGISIIIEALTDNKNRTASEVRSILTKNGGNLGETGSVAFNFKQVGEISFDINIVNKDEIIMFAIENGATDILEEETIFRIISTPNHFGALRNSIEQKFLNQKHLNLYGLLLILLK